MYTYGPCHSFLICSNREFIPDSRNCDRQKEGHTLLTDKDFPGHPLLFLQPTRSQEGFIKAKSLRLLKSNSSERLLNDNMNKFKSRLRAIGYPDTLVERITCDENSVKEGRLHNKEKETRKHHDYNFYNKMSPHSASTQQHLNEQMAFNLKSTTSERNMQEPPLKRGRSLKIPKRLNTFTFSIITRVLLTVL